jgi:hypothetical protein
MEGEVWKRSVGVAGKQNSFLISTSIPRWPTVILGSAKNAKRQTQKPPEKGDLITIRITTRAGQIYRTASKLGPSIQKHYRAKKDALQPKRNGNQRIRIGGPQIAFLETQYVMGRFKDIHVLFAERKHMRTILITTAHLM